MSALQAAGLVSVVNGNVGPCRMVVMTISETDRAWLAGLFEGEGYLTASHGGTQFRMGIDMCDEDVLRRVLSVTGIGSIRCRGMRDRATKPIWSWRAGQAHQAAALLILIYPWLCARRRAKIDEIVGTWIENPNIGTGWQHRIKTHCPQGHPYDEANTYHGRNASGGTSRACKTCVRAAQKRYEEKKRAA